MPNPRKNETKKDFIARCVRYVMKNEGLSQDKALGRCYGIYRQAKKHKKSSKTKIARG